MNCLLGAVLVCTVGCGEQGPRRYSLSGTVTYDGQPVPGGRILFAPDGAQGISGPGAVADILNGQYQTRPGKGAVGGPHRVSIYGTDGTVATEEHDNTLFDEYKTALDVAHADSNHDFVVPRE